MWGICLLTVCWCLNMLLLLLVVNFVRSYNHCQRYFFEPEWVQDSNYVPAYVAFHFGGMGAATKLCTNSSCSFLPWYALAKLCTSTRTFLPWQNERGNQIMYHLNHVAFYLGTHWRNYVPAHVAFYLGTPRTPRTWKTLFRKDFFQVIIASFEFRHDDKSNWPYMNTL